MLHPACPIWHCWWCFYRLLVFISPPTPTDQTCFSANRCSSLESCKNITWQQLCSQVQTSDGVKGATPKRISFFNFLMSSAHVSRESVTQMASYWFLLLLCCSNFLQRGKKELPRFFNFAIFIKRESRNMTENDDRWTGTQSGPDLNPWLPQEHHNTMFWSTYANHNALQKNTKKHTFFKGEVYIFFKHQNTFCWSSTYLDPVYKLSTNYIFLWAIFGPQSAKVRHVKPLAHLATNHFERNHKDIVPLCHYHYSCSVNMPILIGFEWLLKRYSYSYHLWFIQALNLQYS